MTLSNQNFHFGLMKSGVIESIEVKAPFMIFQNQHPTGL